MTKKKALNPILDNVYSIMHTKIGAKFTVVKMEEFNNWLEEQSSKTRAIIFARLNMLALGHFGDHKRFDGLLELRWKNGNRVYAFIYGHVVIVALYGGNKNAQDRDIKKAKRIRDEILDGSRSIQ